MFRLAGVTFRSPEFFRSGFDFPAPDTFFRAGLTFGVWPEAADPVSTFPETVCSESIFSGLVFPDFVALFRPLRPPDFGVAFPGKSGCFVSTTFSTESLGVFEAGSGTSFGSGTGLVTFLFELLPDLGVGVGVSVGVSVSVSVGVAVFGVLVSLITFGLDDTPEKS